MPAYEVKVDDQTGATFKNGHDVMTVFAEDGDDAKACAGGHFDGDSSGSWANATATEVIVGTDLSPVTDSLGNVSTFVLKVTITGEDTNEHFEYPCVSADSYADAFAAMVILLNTNADIANAAFAGDVLTVSGIADDIGDHTLTATFEYGGVAIPSFLGVVVHEAISAAVLSVASNATVEIPKVLGSSRS